MGCAEGMCRGNPLSETLGLREEKPKQGAQRAASLEGPLGRVTTLNPKP